MLAALLLAASVEIYQHDAVFSSPTSQSQFPKAVDIQGEWLAIGRPYAGSPALSGVVDVHRREPRGWTHHTTLTVQGPSAGDRFGQRVTFSPDGDLFVSASDYDAFAPGDDVGGVIVFQFGGGSWSQVGVLKPDPNNVPLEFGRELAAGDGFIAVTSTFTPTASGEVMIFDEPYSSSIGDSIYAVPISTSGPKQLHVALNGGTLAIGSPSESAVVLMERSGSSWVSTANLTGAGIGHYVAFVGDMVFTAAPYRNSYTGELVGFLPPATTEVAVISPSILGPEFSFDGPLCSSDNSLIAAASGPASGVYRLEFVTGLGWTARGEFEHLGPSFGQRFAADEQSVIIVAPIQGEAAVYSDIDHYQSYCTSTPNSTGQPARIDAYGPRSLSASESLLLIATDLPDGPALAFSGASETQLPFVNGFLCTGPTFIRHGVQQASGGRATFRPWRMPLGANSFQVIFSDPTAGGAGLNMTDAVTVDILP